MGNTLQDLKERRSIRAYKPEQISDAELDAILEAGAWAPSGMGKQSALMVAVQDKATIAEIEKLNAAVTGNASAKTFYGAPTVVVVFADSEVPTWVDDGNMVIANLLLAAHAKGIGSCYVYRAKDSFESEGGKALKKKWGVADKYKGVGNVILGYAAEKPAPKPRKEGGIIKIK